MTGQLQEIAAIIAGAKRLVAFTGSGISAESGIPTFRDPGGLWDRYDPELMRNAEYAATMPLKGAAKDFLQEMLATLEGARAQPGAPGPGRAGADGHTALGAHPEHRQPAY